MRLHDVPWFQTLLCASQPIELPWVAVVPFLSLNDHHDAGPIDWEWPQSHQVFEWHHQCNLFYTNATLYLETDEIEDNLISNILDVVKYHTEIITKEKNRIDTWLYLHIYRLQNRMYTLAHLNCHNPLYNRIHLSAFMPHLG